MRRVNILLLGVAILITVLWAPVFAVAGEQLPAPPTPLKADEIPALDVPQHVQKHLCESRTGVAGGQVQLISYSVQLDEDAACVQLDGAWFKDSLVFAAWIYAMDKGDYRVTVEEVINGGYYPYQLLPSSLLTGQCISGETSRYLLYAEDLSNIGSPNWRLQMKGRILQAFYKNLYFPFNEEAALDQMMAPEMLQRYDQFWINPLDGKPAVGGMHAGNLVQMPVVAYMEEFSTIPADDPRRLWEVVSFLSQDSPALSETGKPN